MDHHYLIHSDEHLKLTIFRLSSGEEPVCSVVRSVVGSYMSAAHVLPCISRGRWLARSDAWNDCDCYKVVIEFHPAILISLQRCELENARWDAIKVFGREVAGCQ